MTNAAANGLRANAIIRKCSQSELSGRYLLSSTNLGRYLLPITIFLHAFYHGLASFARIAASSMLDRENGARRACERRSHSRRTNRKAQCYQCASHRNGFQGTKRFIIVNSSTIHAQHHAYATDNSKSTRLFLDQSLILISLSVSF